MPETQRKRWKSTPEQRHASYLRNREKVLKYTAEWAKRNPEKRREIMARHRERHREERRAGARAYKRQRRAADPQADRDTQNIYYAANIERLRARANAYHAAHKDIINERLRAFRKKFPDYTRISRQKHPEAHRAGEKRRRAKKANAAINDLTAAQWEDIKKHYEYRCVYCKRKMKRLTQDHLTPISRNGNHTVHNVVPACQSCNSKKGKGPVLVPVQPLLFSLS